ncbi:MAG: GIY-YIG nuclease family protein [Gallionella sp.]|nr:GIY-YIG nuclease family protein [Gallionella sp.]
MSFWVYILRCADGSYYTGQTDNLEHRLYQHHAGAITSCYTFKRRPLQLTFSQDFPSREEALASEQQIKGWSRKKKEAMMRGDWDEVSKLAKSPHSVRPESRAVSESNGRTIEGQDSLVPVHGSTVRQAHDSPRLADTASHNPPTVRPEPVEGQDSLVPAHGSTVRQAHGSPRTGESVSHTPTPVRPEPVEGQDSLVPAHGSTSSPRTELGSLQITGDMLK